MNLGKFWVNNKHRWVIIGEENIDKWGSWETVYYDNGLTMCKHLFHIRLHGIIYK